MLYMPSASPVSWQTGQNLRGEMRQGRTEKRREISANLGASQRNLGKYLRDLGESWRDLGASWRTTAHLAPPRAVG